MATEVISPPTGKKPPAERELMRAAVADPRSAVRALVKNSLYRFIQYFWDTYTENDFIPNWHIEKICEELEIMASRVADRQPKHHDLIINVPPGTTKTATVSIMFPVWCWVNWHWMRFITTSHSDALSLESAEYSRDIIRSEKFRQLFPELEVRDDKDQKSNYKVIKKVPHYTGHAPRILQGGSRVSTTVGSKITGFHADIIIIDDLIDPKGAMSEANIRQANHYIDHTLSTRKVDKAVTPTVMIMQRLAQDDPTGHLLEKENKKIRHICLPGELRNYGAQLKPAEWRKFYTDDLLDARRMTWEVLQDMLYDLGQYGYAGQVGQKPSPPGGGMFKVDRFNILTAPPEYHYVVRTVRYWDKAATVGAGAYTVGVKMSLLTDGRFVIEDVKRGQWSSEVREKIIRRTAQADGDRVTVLIEQEPGSGGKESAQNTIRNLAGFNVQADRPTGDKARRADPYSVQVNEGNVSLLQGDWNRAYKEELENFPNSTYKDQVDASSGAFAALTGKKTARLLNKRK